MLVGWHRFEVVQGEPRKDGKCESDGNVSDVPPLNSYISTSCPRRAAYSAARAPTGPAPTITVFCRLLFWAMILVQFKEQEPSVGPER